MFLIILRISTLIIFVFIILMSNNKRRAYLFFILFAFPLLDLRVTSADYGGLTIFDVVTYIIVPFVVTDLTQYNIRNKIYTLLVFLLLLVLLIGAVASETFVEALLNLFAFYPIFVFSSIFLKECYEYPKFINKVLKVLKAISIMSIVWLSFQIILGYNISFYEELNPNINDLSGIRYPGFFQDPQKYAQFLAMSSFLFLIKLKSNHKLKLYDYSLFIVHIIAILLTGGRSALLGAAAGLTLIIAFQSTAIKIKLLITSLIVGALLISNAESFIAIERLKDIDESYDTRAAIWNGAINIYKTHPILGIGIGNYLNYVTNHDPTQSILLDNEEIMMLDQPESGYLKVLTEFGGLGFVIFALLIIIIIFRAIVKCVYNKKNINVLILCSSAVSWIVAFVSLYSIIDERIFVFVAILLCLLIHSINFSDDKGYS